MTIRQPRRLPDPQVRWVQADGKPTTDFYQYMRELDQAVRDLITASNTAEIELVDHELRITTLEP